MLGVRGGEEDAIVERNDFLEREEWQVFDDWRHLGMARNEADVILVVGARLGEYDSWGMPPSWGMPSQQTTIQIDADPMSIGLNRPVDVAVVADAKKALAANTGAMARLELRSATCCTLPR